MKTYLLTILLLFGSTLVFYSLSPYFSALGLVIVSLSSCLMLSHLGISFLALILLLVYIGGMLMVFMYSSALTKDRFPIMSKIKEMIVLSFFLTLWTTFLLKNQKWKKMKMKTKLSSSISMEGASYLFHYSMLPFFYTAGYILLVTLMVMLKMSRGMEKATLQTL